MLGFLTGKKKKEDNSNEHLPNSPQQSPLTSPNTPPGMNNNVLNGGSGGNDMYPSLNEIQVLSDHKGAIKNLLKIDSERLASAGDDNIIFIWSISTGRLLMRLDEHKDTVTCLLSFGNTLVSGSRDKTIKIWNLAKAMTYDESTRSYSLKSYKTLEKYHERGLKFLEKLPIGFCSASNDEDLVIFSEEGEHIRNIVRIHKEYIHGILCVNNYIITSSSNPFLVAYRYDSVNEAPRQLAAHQDCVNCLMNINDKHFVTGSQDKSIILWDSINLVPKFQQHCSNTINYLFPIKNYILATIHKGFNIFDMNGKTLLEYKPVDEKATTELNGAISLYDNSKIITWADMRVSFWSWNISDLNNKKISKSPLKPTLIGEMKVHTDYINCLTVLDDNSIATGSSDCNIVLWKDGKYQSNIRNVIVSSTIFELLTRFNQSEQDSYLDEEVDKIESADDLIVFK